MGLKRTDECCADCADKRANKEAGGVRFGCRLIDVEQVVKAHRDIEVVSDQNLDLARENERLRRENRILKEERDILN